MSVVVGEQVLTVNDSLRLVDSASKQVLDGHPRISHIAEHGNRSERGQFNIRQPRHGELHNPCQTAHLPPTRSAMTFHLLPSSRWACTSARSSCAEQGGGFSG